MLSMKPSATAVLGFGPGHVANYKGSTIEIAQCPPVNTTFRKVDHCFEDLPIWDEKGNPVYRDPENHVIKEVSTIVDCHLDYRTHKINNFFFAQKPNLVKLKEIPKVLMPPELTAQDAFEYKFESLGTPYGPELDDWIPGILMSTLHITAVHNMGDMAISSSLPGIYEDSHNEYSASYFQNIFDHLGSIEDWIKTWFGVIVFIIMCIFLVVIFGMCGTSVCLSCYFNGWKSSETSWILFSPFYALIDFIMLLAVYFRLTKRKPLEQDIEGQEVGHSFNFHLTNYNNPGYELSRYDEIQ